MRNIVLARIDDRLIHGQVITGWLKVTNGNIIYIVDDPLSKDAFMQRAIKATAPAGVHAEIYSVEKAAELLNGESENPNEKVVIITKVPEVYEQLIAKGVKLDKIILGGMGSAKPGRKRINKNVSATDEEVACMKRIIAGGTKIEFQLVPAVAGTDASTFLK